MIVILFLLAGALHLSEAPDLILKQSEAVLGEPVLIEIKEIKEEYWNLYPIEIEIDGPIYDCIVLNDRWELPKDKINIVDYLKFTGEYKISIALDEMYACSNKLWLYDEEMKKFDSKRKPIYKKFKEREEKKDRDLKILKRYNIKIKEPIDYDWKSYKNILKDQRSLEEFWSSKYEGIFKEFIEETIKHPESNYFPWAVYIYFAKEGTFSTKFYENIIKEENLKEILNYRNEKRIRSEDIDKNLKEIKNLIDEIEKRYIEFPLLPKLMISRILAGNLLDESKEVLKKKAEVMKERGNFEERKAADIIIRSLEGR